MHRTRRTVCHTLIAGLMCIAGRAAAQPEPSLDFTAQQSAEFLDTLAPTNAALVYYQLFLQENKPLAEGYIHFNLDQEDDQTFTITREDAEKAFLEGQAYLDNLCWASNLPECDFGIQYQQGWNVILPHLGKLRQMTRILAADARRHFAAGETDKAAERLAAVYNMARQLSDERILISSLVSAAMCARAHEVVKEAVESGAPTEKGRDQLIASLERFSHDDPFGIHECVRMECAISAGWVIRQFPAGGAGSKLAESGVIDAGDRAQIRRFDEMDGATLRHEAERMVEYYRQAYAVWDDKEAVAKLEALGAIVEAGGFGELAKGLGAAFSKAKEQSDKAEGQLQDMLDTLRAYQPEKPEADSAQETAQPARR